MTLPLYVVKAIVGDAARAPPYGTMDAGQWKELAEIACPDWCSPEREFRGVKIELDNPEHERMVLDQILSTALKGRADQSPLLALARQVYDASRSDAKVPSQQK